MMQFLSQLSPWWRRKSVRSLILGLCLLAGWPSSVNAKTAADYFVHSLPGAPEGIPLLKMYAGHIEIDPAINANLFFWFFENKHLADKSRTVIWLNGGPGCSSEDGALMEIGPYRVGEGGNLRLNEGSWDEFANVLFIDNPVGTGFSYVDTDSYVHELSDMANQLILFLDNFFTIFPQYVHDDIYIAGESYAGQHIPYFANAILERNKQKQAFKDWDWQDDANYIPWNLKGLLIGNGWISGPDQYPSYLQFAYQHNLLTPGTAEATTIEKQQAICDKSLSDGGKDHVDDRACENILGEILRVTARQSGDQLECTNMYDIRLTDSYPSCGMNWPPDLTYVTPYLRRDDVRNALHVNPDKKTGWTECNGVVGSAFKAQNSKPSVDLLPNLLSQLPIVLFSGERDLICNHIGTEELINNLEWNGGKGFEISDGVWAPRRAWTFEGEPAGLYQEARNLTYILFYNSSHMVPFDYPRRTRDMLDRFMGVDIGAIGGVPADSRIDGEKGPVTSVGGTPNSTFAEEEQASKLKEAEWRAYQRSGEVALVVVAVAAGVWGWFVWRARRRHAGYLGVSGDDDSGSGPGGALGRLPIPVWKRGAPRNGARDVEAADFDENELENLAGKSNGGAQHDMDRERYSLGDDSEDENDEGTGKTSQAPQANGHGR